MVSTEENSLEQGKLDIPDDWWYDSDVAHRIKWYEGETGIENKPDGLGMAWLDDGTVYNGQWLYGAMEGHGIMEYSNGDLYEGKWRQGKCEDTEGFYLCLSEKPTKKLKMQFGDAYIGEIDKDLDKTCGEGEFDFADGSLYRGHIEYGLFEKYGLYKSMGFTFEGYFREGMLHGAGCLVNEESNSGSQLIGNWKYGERAGVFAIVQRGESDMVLIDKTSSVCSFNKSKSGFNLDLTSLLKLKMVIGGGFESSLRRKVRFYIDRELSLYFESLSACDMSHLVKCLFGSDLNKIQKGNLYSKNMVCWVDVVPFKVKERKGTIRQHAMVCVLGMEHSGKKQLLGFYHASVAFRKACFWKQVFKDLQKRGLNDVLVWYVDASEKSLKSTIKTFFPFSIVEVQDESFDRVSTLENKLRFEEYEDEVYFSSVDEFKRYVCRYVAANKKEWEETPAGWAYFLNSLAEKFGERYEKF